MASKSEGTGNRAGEKRRVDDLDPADIVEYLREVLATRAVRLGLEPDSIDSPAPGAVTARTSCGTLLRLDARSYQQHDLNR